MAKARLDKLLVKRGLAENVEEAHRLIEGSCVRVGGILKTSSKSQVDPGVDIKIQDDKASYASRGAFKLEKALESFSINPQGMVAMDVGASTGGFTDLLLQRGAAKIYAIDVGYGQLAWHLRNDERVVVLERENVRTLDIEKIPDTVNLTVIDVSFISLTKILEKVAELMKAPSNTPILALIKPQFEAPRGDVGEGGVVRDPLMHQACIDKVCDFSRDKGFSVGEVVESPIRGPAGNIEFLVHLGTP